MFSKSNLISTIANTIWVYFGGYFLWEFLGPSLFEGHEESSPEQLHLIIACLISSFAFSTIYLKLANGGHSVSNGVSYGLWVGILIGFGERWFDLAFGMYSLTDSITNGILNLIIFIVMGIITSLVYGKLSGKTS